MSILALDPGQVVVGNDAAWALSFHTEQNGVVAETPVLLRGRNDYYAEIEATLPADLSGGSCKFTIEGFTDDDHKAIAQTDSAKKPTVVRLYLYWRDTNSSVTGYLANVVGQSGLLDAATVAALKPALVAELSITKVTRKLGERRYETVVEAQERAFATLSARIPDDSIKDKTFSDAVTALCTGRVTLHTEFDTVSSQVAALDQHTYTFPAQTKYVEALSTLGQALERATGKGGRGMLLVRKGELYFGVRSIPLEDDAKSLSLASGLIETEVTGSVSADPTGNGSALTPSPTRRQFRFTLKGRPDIMPGDAVAFAQPPEEGSGPASALLAAAMSGTADLEQADVTAYVTSVQHRLGRASGFSTTVTALELQTGEDGWDSLSPGGSRARPEDSGVAGASSSAAEQAARAVKQAARSAANAIEVAEVGEVRKVNTSGTDDVAPAQTLRVVRGLTPPDGAPNAARRLDVQTQSPATFDGVAYATPFAWGKAGLVLPRYPGTRVVMVHRNGELSDPIDVGALWTSSARPDAAQPGDWWLILPSNVQNQRSSAADDAQIAPYADKATNDLIDGTGNRVIEVGSLTVTALGTANLASAGTRPEAADEQAITLAFGQSSIVIKDDGIHIRANKITLEATESVEVT